MRILLAFALIAALGAGCGKKKPAAAPSGGATESEKAGDDMKDKDSPDADDDSAPDPKSADPQEGGQ